MAATHKSLRMWIQRHRDCVDMMIEIGDAEGAGMLAKMAARDAFKLDSSLRQWDSARDSQDIIEQV